LPTALDTNSSLFFLVKKYNRALAVYALNIPIKSFSKASTKKVPRSIFSMSDSYPTIAISPIPNNSL